MKSLSVLLLLLISFSLVQAGRMTELTNGWLYTHETVSEGGMVDVITQGAKELWDETQSGLFLMDMVGEARELLAQKKRKEMKSHIGKSFIESWVGRDDFDRDDLNDLLDVAISTFDNKVDNEDNENFFDRVYSAFLEYKGEDSSANNN